MVLTKEHVAVFKDTLDDSLPPMVGGEYKYFREFRELTLAGYLKVANFSSRNGEFYGNVQLTLSGQHAIESLL
ncbi:hypothetical protein [Alkalimonas amylolytica]|uniref:Uncharacterized protein n=1 Tax=Alkalimonas amylolytica TaxID=152573 RepID=A0A1H3Y4Q4_ALKAM|nr:hypothetical protein [Alkalimonas amylolytica]SEA06563.1 hypothetical protein SAMN04488051_101540 [Alkalimonas amylolytica]